MLQKNTDHFINFENEIDSTASKFILNFFENCLKNNNTEDAYTFLDLIYKNTDSLLILETLSVIYMQQHYTEEDLVSKVLLKMLELCKEDSKKHTIKLNLLANYIHFNNYSEDFINLLNTMPEEHFMTLYYKTLFYLNTNNDYEVNKLLPLLHEYYPTLSDFIKKSLNGLFTWWELKTGNFKKGYINFVQNEKIQRPEKTRCIVVNIPIWKGEEYGSNSSIFSNTIKSKKTILVNSNFGIGDEFLYIRFCKKIEELGLKAIWRTSRQDLATVFNRNGYNAIFNLNQLENVSNLYQIYAEDLPTALNLDRNELWDGTYIKPCKKYIEKWEKILPSGKKLALKWHGYTDQLRPTMPLKRLKELKYEGTKINLQLEPEYKNDWSYTPKIESIEDTLAILWLCDDVLTSCTNIAHMCGAMNKPRTLVAVTELCCFVTWIENTHWYGDKLQAMHFKNSKNWTNFFKDIEVVLNS
jgi:hypothetical protein